MRNRHLVFQMEFYDTYEFVSLVHSLAINGFESPKFYDGFDDLIKQNISTIFSPFQKLSVLHQFIALSIYYSFVDNVDDVVLDSLVNDQDYVLWVNDALDVHKIPHLDFQKWLKTKSLALKEIEHESIILDYYDYLYKTGPLKKLIERIADEVFFILFLNRDFLFHFNSQISLFTTNIKIANLPENSKRFFKKDGVLKRVNIPIWARKAVFYRDRGLCSNCQKDISGLVNIQNEKHFDHIIPLAMGGLNDVSNLQLLCETCNINKSSKEVQPSKMYEKWY